MEMDRWGQEKYPPIAITRLVCFWRKKGRGLVERMGIPHADMKLDAADARRHQYSLPFHTSIQWGAPHAQRLDNPHDIN